MTHAAALLLPALLAVFVPVEPQPSADALARGLQQRYQRVTDFSADFQHVYEGGVLHKKIVERGQVIVRKPGKMRWTYTAPERKEFVSDGKRLYSYVPADRQVVISTVAAADQTSSPAMFLAGRGDVLRDFVASLASVPGLAAGDVALKLVPVVPQREYEQIVLVLDRATLRIERLITTDAQGGTSTLIFEHLRENVGLPDKAFVFTIPRGVEVITDGSRTR